MEVATTDIALDEIGLELSASQCAVIDQLIQMLGQNAQQGLGACIVLNSWTENPLAQALQASLAELAQGRIPVPDGYFLNQTDAAPQLIAIPSERLENLTDPDAHALLHWLRLCVAQACSASEQRLVPQHFSGVIWGQGKAGDLAPSVAEHWVQLGLQKRLEPTDTDPAFERDYLFRYQDPRVMQAVWNRLGMVARALWMGPVQQWWAVPMQWGRPLEGRSGRSLQTVASQWFIALRPSEEAVQAEREKYLQSASRPPTITRLLSNTQWHQAHASMAGNQAWRAFDDMGLAGPYQPNANQMDGLLAEGATQGLEGQDLVDFALCTWIGTGTLSTQPLPIAWTEPAHAARLRAIQSHMQSHPDSGFGKALSEVD